eukprot:CAMPEP_0201704188 /NCGR_PEP_ID=MMETSP0578-20130828/42067_1 /ASSEMBLY_ACC=CAM_ASM_000663 /TAXON_ID=267565 /ORGANISM="Skeletonema grethea, Strain CCMP 1804" /LENGTH=612 /DNA_ID=CAMNT_0048192167 /DNA_START=27 /DNA_END=1866 /DNA_ORIENTATION=-
MSTLIPLKWGKQTLHLKITPKTTTSDLKYQIQTLTHVPPERQKILCPKLWKGALKDSHVLTFNNSNGGVGGVMPDNIKMTLIGTAEKLIEKSIEERPQFVEDLTEEEIWRLETAAATNNNSRGAPDGDRDVIIDIAALQKHHGMERDDGKMEVYEYNRLVSGLPQHQIEDMLLDRLQKKNEGTETTKQSSTVNNTTTNDNHATELKGEVAMTMGLQLRRAYVNSIGVLDNGTLISGLDDGHVQFWRRGEMILDARHTGGCVDEIVIFPSMGSRGGGRPAFATAGDGSICLWTQDGHHITSLPCIPGTTVSSLTVGNISNNDEEGGVDGIYLAACFRITRQTNPNQFRLVPQNESERRRREVAEMQEQLIQSQLLDVTRRVKVWMYDASEVSNGSSNGRVGLREELIVPQAAGAGASAVERASSITKVVDMSCNLVCGDETGLQIFDATTRDGGFQKKLALSFQHPCDIDCMEPLHDDFLAVSISRKSNEEMPVPSSAVKLQMPVARGVYIVDTKNASMRAVLDGHRDRVTCICPLPDGRLLTAGGKFDATVQLWYSETLTKVTNSRDENDDEIMISSESKQMKKPGYVFDLKVLPDNNGSAVYAIAAAGITR